MVIATVTVQTIIPGTAVQMVITLAAVEKVIAVAAAQPVGPGATDQAIVAIETNQIVIAITAFDGIGRRGADQTFTAVATHNHCRTAGPAQERPEPCDVFVIVKLRKVGRHQPQLEVEFAQATLSHHAEQKVKIFLKRPGTSSGFLARVTFLSQASSRSRSHHALAEYV